MKQPGRKQWQLPSLPRRGGAQEKSKASASGHGGQKNKKRKEKPASPAAAPEGKETAISKQKKKKSKEDESEARAQDEPDVPPPEASRNLSPHELKAIRKYDQAKTTINKMTRCLKEKDEEIKKKDEEIEDLKKRLREAESRSQPPTDSTSGASEEAPPIELLRSMLSAVPQEVWARLQCEDSTLQQDWDLLTSLKEAQSELRKRTEEKIEAFREEFKQHHGYYPKKGRGASMNSRYDILFEIGKTFLDQVQLDLVTHLDVNQVSSGDDLWASDSASEGYSTESEEESHTTAPRDAGIYKACISRLFPDLPDRLSPDAPEKVIWARVAREEDHQLLQEMRPHFIKLMADGKNLSEEHQRLRARYRQIMGRDYEPPPITEARDLVRAILRAGCAQDDMYTMKEELTDINQQLQEAREEGDGGGGEEEEADDRPVRTMSPMNEDPESTDDGMTNLLRAQERQRRRVANGGEEAFR